MAGFVCVMPGTGREEGAGSVTHAGGVGGVSRRGGALGLLRLEGLVESCGNAVGTVESGGAVRGLCLGAWVVFAGPGVL